MVSFEFSGSPQKAFFELGPVPALFMGGFGSGKTVICVIKMLYLLSLYPNSRGAIVRRTFSQLQKTTVSTLKQWLPQEYVARWNEQQGIVELKNGSILYLLYLDSEESLNVLRGLELNFCAVDQMEELSEGAWDLLDTRVGRWSGASRAGGWPSDWPHKNSAGQPLPPKYLFGSANSPGFDSWVYKRFAKSSPEHKEWSALGYTCITASSRDNKFLGQQNLNTMLSKGDDFVKRFVDAVEWGAREGVIFEVSPLSIIVPDNNIGLLERIKAGMKLHRVMDHGDTAPTCVLWYGTDHEGRVYYYREYYQGNRLVSDHRRAVFELSKEDGTLRSETLLPKYYSELADPSIFALSRGRGLNDGPRWSIADEWSDSKLGPDETAIRWKRADNNEPASILRIKEYLRVDPNVRHPITGEPGSPRVFFIIATEAYPNGIRESLKELQSARYTEIGSTAEGKKLFSEERDESVPDHGLDPIRYSLLSRPSLGPTPIIPKAPTGFIRISDYDAATEKQPIIDKASFYQRRGLR